MLQVCGFDLRPCRAKHLRAVCDGEIVCVCACCRSGTVNGTFLFGVTKWASWVVLVVKNPPANAGDLRDMGLIPGLGRSPGEGNGNPVFLPGEYYGQRSLVGYSPQGYKKSDTTEVT